MRYRVKNLDRCAEKTRSWFAYRNIFHSHYIHLQCCYFSNLSAGTVSSKFDLKLFQFQGFEYKNFIKTINLIRVVRRHSRGMYIHDLGSIYGCFPAARISHRYAHVVEHWRGFNPTRRTLFRGRRGRVALLECSRGALVRVPASAVSPLSLAGAGR